MSKEGGFVMPSPERVYSTCNYRGTYEHQVPLLYFGE